MCIFFVVCMHVYVIDSFSVCCDGDSPMCAWYAALSYCIVLFI